MLTDILVTGGAGFIGSHSVERLLARGCRVRVLDNLSDGKRGNLPLNHPNLELMIGDITNPDDVDAAMDGMHRCLHLAAQTSVPKSVQSPEFSCKQNILGFVQVLNGCQRHQVKRLVYASSAAVYGDPEMLPVKESSPVSPTSPYGLEKQVNEQYAALYRHLYGFSSMGMRYFNVYGPRQDPASSYAGVISIFVSQFQQGKTITIYGDGKQSRDFIYVGDIARMNEAALMNEYSGVCSIATGHSITLLELTDVLSAFTRNPRIRFAPVRDGDISASEADISLMKETFDIVPDTRLEDGLRMLWNATLKNS